jgi:uracil-DNA glycosylase
MDNLLKEIRKCRVCTPHLPLGPNPVLAANSKSKICIIGHAPGKIVHHSGVPWEDKSGDRLRDWLGIGKDTFYNSSLFAIIPMGFCYPGTGKTGDMPPRKECAPLWHGALNKKMRGIELTLLIGQHAQSYYLTKIRKRNLTETVKSYREYLPQYLPLPHPSPRNNIWMKKNPWFKDEVIPILRDRISDLIF